MKIEIYDGKHILEFSDKGHRYTVDGEAKTGTTTMLDLLGKPGLLHWAANMASQHWLEMYKSGVLFDPDECYELARKAHLRSRDGAGHLGTKTHKQIEQLLRGEVPEIFPGTEPMMQAYNTFLDVHQPTLVASERPVYSEKLDYCGTFDIAFEREGKLILGDFKTSSPEMEYNEKTKRYTGRVRPRIEHLLQLGAYDTAWKEETNNKVDGYAVIYITKKGELHYFETDETQIYRETWEYLAKLYKLKSLIDNSINKFER